MSDSGTDSSRGTTIVVVVSTVTALSTIFVAARVYTRGVIMGKLHLDDYFVIVSVFFGWLSQVFAVLAVKSGQGRHFDTLTLDEKSGAILWTMIGFCPGVMSFGIPKLAVVSLLTRLLNPSFYHRIFLWSLAGTTMISLFASIGVLFGQCQPSRAQWDFSITEKKCLSPWVLVHLAIWAGVMSAFTDLYLAVYPAVVLYKLHLKLRKKIALMVALGIGSIASVVAIYKTTRLPSLASSDFSYATSDLVMWTCIEGSTIIIASCIPTLQPLADRVVGSSFFGSSHDQTPGYYKNGASSGYGAGASSKGRGGVVSGSRGRGDLDYHRRNRSNNIELSSTASDSGFHPNHYHKNGRRGAPDPNGLTFLDKEGSEESILRHVQADPNTAATATATANDRAVGEETSGEGSGSASDLKNGIVRTDVITVSYAQQDGKERNGSITGGSRWKRGH